MARPLFSDLSASDKIALLTKLAKRYASRGNVPKVVARSEIAAALRGTPEEKVKRLGWVVSFIAGRAGVSYKTIAEDLNDADHPVQDPQPQPQPDETVDRIVKSYLFLNSDVFEEERMEKGIEGRETFAPTGLKN